MPEPRGRKRVSDTDGRIDLDKADMEMARKAAEDGLDILRKSKVRLATVTPATYSYYAPMQFQPPPEINPIKPIRWCDIDDEMENDPLVNLENWEMGVSQNTESSYNDVLTVESAANLKEKEVCIEGQALREAPHVSHKVADFDPSTEYRC